MSTVSSITRTGQNEPFNLQVSREQITFHEDFYKFGYGSCSQTLVTIWDNDGGLYQYPSGGTTTLTVSSSSDSDRSGGSAAQSVTVQGLDENYLEVSETINLEGQSAVATSNTFTRVNRAFVAEAGVDGDAAGDIYIGEGTVSSGVPANVYSKITQGNNQTLQTVYTVPANKTLYLDDIVFSAAVSTGNKTVTMKFVTREFGSNVFRVRYQIPLQSGFAEDRFYYPLKIPSKTDIQVRAIADSDNNFVSGTYQGVLIQE